MEVPLRLHSLGELRLEGAQQTLGSPRKALALLTYLARSSARRGRREELMALFWGDRPEARARQSLRQVLLELRNLLGGAMEAGGELVVLKETGWELDAIEFERDVAARRYRQAVERWHGEFLADAEDVGGEQYRAWVEQEREGLRRKLAFALERLVQEEESSQSWPDAARWADIWTRALPYDERAHCKLIDALDHTGQTEEALARHAAFLVRLRHDVDLEPSSELLALGERLRKPIVAQPPPPPDEPSKIGWTVIGKAEASLALGAVWQRVEAGESGVMLLGGAHSQGRALAFAEFKQALHGTRKRVLLSATGVGGEPWGTARRLLAALRHAPGLSGAPDVALAELSALVPEIRDRFPRLPYASGKADALADAIAQVFADVAAEAPLVVHVGDVGTADVESRYLLDALLHRDVPGVLFVLSDEVERIDTLRIGERATHARRLVVESSIPPKTLVFPTPAPRSKLRLRSVGVLAAAALILTTTLAALLIPHARATSVPDQLAVLPFTLHAAEGYAYLREGLAEMLSTSLDGVEAVRTVDAHSVLRQATSMTGGLDPRSARELARKVGAGLFVLGSVTESAGVLRVQATLYRQSDDRPLVRATAEGSADSIFRLVDELAEQILSHMDESPSARFSRIAALTTDSLAALKSYLDGESQLRRFLVRDAFDNFQRAVSIDSTFALAWYGQATAASWMLSPEIAIEAAENAVRHSGRLSPRDRGIVEMMRAFLTGRADEAERIARLVLAYYADDVERRMQLAEVLFHFSWRRGRSFTDAEPELRRVLRFEPDHSPALVHLAQIALHQGRRTEADTLTRRLIASYGEHPSAAWMGTLNAVANGDDRALDTRLKELYAAGDWWLTLGLWNLSNYSPDLTPADRASLLLADSGRSRPARAIGHLARAHIELARGRWQNARAELGQLAVLNPAWYQEYSALLAAAPFLPLTSGQYQALRDQLRAWNADALAPPPRPVDPRPWATVHDQAHGEIRHYLLGLLSLRLGDFRAAAAEAAVLEARAGTDGPATLARGLAGGLRAQLLRLQDRHADALAVLDATTLEAPFEYAMVSSFWSQALERFLRAELLVETGQYDDALAVLRTLSETPVLDAIYRGPAELKAGEIAERRGDRARAITHYRRFIQHWQDCDPELRPMVVDAQRRIERLQSSAYTPPT